MAKTKKTKPSRRKIEETLANMYKGMQFVGEKLHYLEKYCSSNEKVIDLVLEFLGKKEEFMKFFEERIMQEKKDREKGKKES